MQERTILLIDDSHLDRYIIAEFLGTIDGCRYKLIECSSTQAGLIALDKTVPDCVLLDNIMIGSNMNGIEALPFIRKAKNKLTPVIMITGSSSEKVKKLAMNNGVSYFMDKMKLSPELLHSVIGDLVEQNKEQRQAAL